MEQINLVKEIANQAIEDGQMHRPFMNLFNELYDEIKGKQFEFEGEKFTDRIQFLRHLEGCAASAAMSAEAWKEDEPEEYEKTN